MKKLLVVVIAVLVVSVVYAWPPRCVCLDEVTGGGGSCPTYPPLGTCVLTNSVLYQRCCRPFTLQNVVEETYQCPEGTCVYNIWTSESDGGCMEYQCSNS